jgi:hypothetical protein
MCRQAHACDRELEENKRYALSNRFEQHIDFLVCYKARRRRLFLQIKTGVGRLEKTALGKKTNWRKQEFKMETTF